MREGENSVGKNRHRAAWATAVRVITRESGNKLPRELEQIFHIGTGETGAPAPERRGHAWRYWINAKRLAEPFTIDRVVNTALEKGWLNPDPIEARAILDLPSEVVQEWLAEMSPFVGRLLPDPPLHRTNHRHMARLAAHVLMEDVLNAMNINGWFYRGFERTQRKLKRGSKIMETTELAMAQSVEETIEWRKAVNFISDLVRKNHDTDVLRAQLTVTYKRQGYR